MAKAKDNKKVNVNNAKAKVTDITNINNAIALFNDAVNACENSTKEKARIAYAIKANELFKERDAKNLKEYINDICGGTLCGVTYSQFNALANIYEYVWSIDALSEYNSNTASALVSYVRKDVKKVINAHNKGVIAPHMSKEEIRIALSDNFGGTCKTVKKAEKITANSEKDNLKTSLAIIGHFIKKNADKNGDVAKAWAEILEYCK